MKFTKCPLCESPLIQQKKGKYGFEIKGKIIPSPVIEYWECPSCGEAFFDQIANKKKFNQTDINFFLFLN